MGSLEIEDMSQNDYFETPSDKDLKGKNNVHLRLIEIKQAGNGPFKGIRVTFTNG